MANEAAQLLVHIVIGATVTFFGAANIVVIIKTAWHIRGLLGDVKEGQAVLDARLKALEAKGTSESGD